MMYCSGAHARLYACRARCTDAAGQRRPGPFWPMRWQISHVPLVLKISSPAFDELGGVTLPPPSEQLRWRLGLDLRIEFAVAGTIRHMTIGERRCRPLTPTGRRMLGLALHLR